VVAGGRKAALSFSGGGSRVWMDRFAVAVSAAVSESDTCTVN
jgi:hypothetical protein